MTLTLNFQGQIWNSLYLGQKWSDCHETKKQTCRLNSKPQMWPSYLNLAVTLTLNFQGQIWNSWYLGQKWSNCYETKRKHVNWTLSLNCDYRIWPGPWPWPWIVKVKYGICCISAKNGPIATKWKANILIEPCASNMIIEFDLGHDLNYAFSRSNLEFAISQPKMVWLPQNEKYAYRMNWQPQWPSSLTLAMNLKGEV